jgi:superfamily II DNA or RNA helicase
MHFRQILGRILRRTNSKNQEAVLYMPAEPKLLEYAYRVKQDVPFEADVVTFEKMKANDEDDLDGVISEDVILDNRRKLNPKSQLKLSEFESVIDHQVFEENSNIIEEHFLTSSYDNVVNVFGRFRQESIALGLSGLK